jgi:uncharacterized protein (TIGR03435 family)
MSNPNSTGLNRARKFWLAVAGIAALAGPLVIGTVLGLGNSPAIWAQTPAANPPNFAAASIKPLPCQPGMRCGGGNGTERLKFTPGSVSSYPEGITTRGIFLEAYHLALYQLPGGPSWLDSDRFELEAVTETRADENQMRRMLQSLVAERFKLVIHRETREMPVYFLTVGKNGARLQEQKEGQPAPATAPSFRGLFLTTKMDHFIAFISTFGIDRPVLDKTGLDGVYYFPLPFSGDRDDDVKIAVEDTFGLKFESHKAPVEVFVIDHVEKPSPN